MGSDLTWKSSTSAGQNWMSSSGVRPRIGGSRWHQSSSPFLNHRGRWFSPDMRAARVSRSRSGRIYCSGPTMTFGGLGARRTAAYGFGGTRPCRVSLTSRRGREALTFGGRAPATDAERLAPALLRPMVSEIIRWGCFVQYLQEQFERFSVASCMSHSACGMNSFVERNRLTCEDPTLSQSTVCCTCSEVRAAPHK